VLSGPACPVWTQFPGIAALNGTVYGSSITYASAKPGAFSPLMTIAGRAPPAGAIKINEFRGRLD
jgi:hypothetical protein